MQIRGDRNSQRYKGGKETGIGLIEVLIAVVLISIGFLAAARMQVEGMRFSQGAYYQSQAYFMASDMIDRMRSNVQGVKQGHYANATTSAGAGNPQCDINACAARSIAEQDLFDWSANLHSIDGNSGFVPALPSSDNTQAQGRITELSAGIYDIELRWSETIGKKDKEQVLNVVFAMEES